MSLRRYKSVLALAILFAAVFWIVGPPAPAAPPVTVDEVIPNVGEQGAQNLKVKIKGKGFKNGAKVRFKLNDEEDFDIAVGPTTFISSREIECDITIDSEAALDFRDVEVELLSGRKGGGTDAFRVEAAGGGGGNEVVMGVTMNGIDVNPSGAPSSGSAEIEVSFTNSSTHNGAPLTAIASIMVWAERCGGVGDFATTEIDLALEPQQFQPQLNCTREDYRSIAADTPAGFPTSQTVNFSGLPAGDYVFFVDLNTNHSSNYAWKHGFAVGSVP